MNPPSPSVDQAGLEDPAEHEAFWEPIDPDISWDEGPATDEAGMWTTRADLWTTDAEDAKLFRRIIFEPRPSDVGILNALERCAIFHGINS